MGTSTKGKGTFRICLFTC